MLKDKYEISLWEDYLVNAVRDKNNKIIVPAHYEEKKIAIIGSDTMTSQIRAIEPHLVENINGTNTFTFKMFYTYYDNITGEKTINPFLSLMVNERKVKIYWKNKWYDMVIKGIQEDSNGKSITYTCKDLFIKELSKTGFNLEFDNELENNQGTIGELAEKILEGSDWQLGASDLIRQKRQESVYLLEKSFVNGFNATNEITNESITIEKEKKILVFYSTYQNKESYFQFLYNNGNDFSKDYSSGIVIGATNCVVDGVTWSSGKEDDIEYDYVSLNGNLIIKIPTRAKVSETLRGERLVRSQKQIFDSALERYVELYEHNSSKDLYRGYSKTVFNDPTVVSNLLVNTKNFANTEGWSGGALSFQLYPLFDGKTEVSNYTATTYLKLEKGINYLNNGVKNSLAYLPEGFQKGEKYIARVKLRKDSAGPTNSYITETTAISNLSFYSYTLKDTSYTVNTNYFTSNSLKVIDDEWIESELTCSKSISKKSIITDMVGFFIKVSNDCWLEDIEFFKYIEGKKDDKTVRINPGEMEKQSVAQTEYRYYSNENNFLNEEDITYDYVGTTAWTEVKPVYSKDFEKIRSINAKNSNRFNLLQTLAETFECWVKFEIEHDTTGKIIYKDGIPQKFVSFHSEIGQETGIGFTYGIDLKTITRSIDSEQIVTKIIVPQNTNEFAENGFCTIARSKENYSRDTFILNFDYYISQGLLSSGEINKDLYQSTDAIGYYYWLRQYNTAYDEIEKALTAKRSELLKQESLKHTYDTAITSTSETIASTESDILALSGKKSLSAAIKFAQSKDGSEKLKSLVNTRTSLKNALSDYETIVDNLDKSIAALEQYIKAQEDEAKTLLDNINKKHEEFYKKYSRFIEEGSWTSQDYINDDLYYLDALSVGYTSSRPKISYNISVLRLSALEEFRNKLFKLGDISFVEDTEFFGFLEDGITPYKEKVLISEIVSNFDSPENDSFKVQNYKTQFEDLFQRITATTQSLQYAAGEYQRAANAFTSTGELNPNTLQNSILLNQELVIKSQDESIVNDSTGITVTDRSNPNRKVKLTSSGLLISTDGGTTWKNAITGLGISTEYLTAGSINANNINILDGNRPSFRWDSSGINAYYNDATKGLYLNTFVRMDGFGFYGVKDWLGTGEGSENNAFVPQNEEDVWNNANFGFTWDGFFLRNKNNNGGIEISSKNDILIYKNLTETNDEGTTNKIQKEIIKIGKLGVSGNEEIYGIRISNKDGVVMETSSDGELWLQNRLNIGTTSGTNVGIGNLGKDEVINANNTFIVYEDGSIKANKGEFTGTINAKSGSIGGVTISEWIDLGYQVRITSNKGTVINENNRNEPIILTAELFFNGEKIEESLLSFKWKKGENVIENAISSQFTINNFSEVKDIVEYSCEITLNEPEEVE